MVGDVSHDMTMQRWQAMNHMKSKVTTFIYVPSFKHVRPINYTVYVHAINYYLSVQYYYLQVLQQVVLDVHSLGDRNLSSFHFDACQQLPSTPR